jgi:hypothetical protein
MTVTKHNDRVMVIMLLSAAHECPSSAGGGKNITIESIAVTDGVSQSR